ncbi:MAG: signal peptide peptidase SppA [Deltaproteobacteria bacterium]|nr:signal peptide peptidase SppA [Deltaproteobacteria bacterium]
MSFDRASRPIFSIIIATFCLCPASTLYAQDLPRLPLGGESPTVGVHLHAPAPAGGGDAADIEVNPAGLGMLRGGSIRLHHTELREESRAIGTGTALFLAGQLPFLRNISLGFGAQWLRPSNAIGYDEYLKFSLGMALRAGPYASLGLSYHFYSSDDDPGVDNLRSIDLGLVVRPYEWFSLGVVVHDLNTPSYHDLPLQRRYALELALRPFSTQRLELGMGFQLWERRGDIDPQLRLAFEPTWGLKIFGHAEALRRDFYRDGDRRYDVRVSTGLSLSFERMGFTLSTLVARPLAEGVGPLAESSTRSAFQGGSLSLTLSGERQEPLVRPSRRALVIKLNKRLDTRRLFSLLQQLSAIEREEHVTGLLLLVEGPAQGWAKTQEIRNAILRLRKANKRVVTFLRLAGTQQYYLASAADKVLIDPAGGLRVQGLASQAPYLRGLFDKVGIKPQFVRIAEHKTAPEMFTRSDPSAPAKAMQQRLLDGLFTRMVADIAKTRGLARKAVRAAMDQGPFTPPRALSAKLVDALVDHQTLRKKASKLLGAPLAPAPASPRSPPRWQAHPQIAIIALEGDIVRGKSSRLPLVGRKVSGDETIVKALRWAQARSRVRAVVLRIDSPGGSAVASDRIWRAVRALQKIKPVVVSMGDVAASGGYYAACAAQRIYASPSTITGSIGIFSGKFDISGLLNKLGVTFHTLQKGKRATMESMTRAYTDNERRFILDRLRYYYNAFTGAVGAGRKISAKDLDKLARGRIFLGSEAKRVKLVDAMGGLADALRAARTLAKLGDRPVQHVMLPRAPRGLLRRALRAMGAHTAAPPTLPTFVHRVLRALPSIFWYAGSGLPLARLPLQIDMLQMGPPPLDTVELGGAGR